MWSKWMDLIEIRYINLIRKSGNVGYDWVNPVCMVLLGVHGLFFIYSAQSYSGGGDWVKQGVWMVGGVVVYIGASLFNYKLYLGFAHYIYFFSLLLLFLLWSPLGREINHSLSWLDIGVCYLQPSEVAKVGTLILGAGLLARSQVGKVRNSWGALGKMSCVFLLPFILIFCQPDLGSALVFPPLFMGLLYISNLSRKFFLGAFVIFIGLMGILGWDLYGYYREIVREENIGVKHSEVVYKGVLPLKNYQRDRILTYIVPDVVDPKGVGDTWNLRQSLISVGSGGVLGKGHNNGTQAKLGYLPQVVATNDFIFSVLAEERGFVGAGIVIVLYGVLILNTLRIAATSRDRFGMYLGLGVCLIFMTHIFINIGMTIGIVPITGIPLPFLSYGGSFILSCSFLQGIVQSVCRFRRDF